MLEIPFLEFKRIFRSQCSGGNCGEGNGEGEWESEETRAWRSSRCEQQGARLRGEKMNNELRYGDEWIDGR